MSTTPPFPSQQPYTPRHLAEKILASRTALEGEHKQVTVLFCDLAGSTEIAATLGPEAMHALLNRFFELALAEVHRYEGTINQFLGDGFMALFGAPVAHEDHATRAILAAVAIQNAVRDGPLGVSGATQLSLRVGIHTGTVVVGAIGDDLRMDYTAVGDTTHLAARLQQLAASSTILISEATHRLVAAYVESAFLGQREIKGLPPQPVYRVEGLKPGATRFDVALRRGLTPLVGRRRELELLRRCYDETRAGGMRVVHLVGEAGLGKSRLLHELRQQLASEAAFFLEGHCTSYGGSTAFLPFIEVIRHAFRIGAGNSRAEIEGKLRRGLELLGLKDDSVPYLLNLLGLNPGTDAFHGLDGEVIGARTRDLLAVLLRARCRLSPVILLLDDLHWSDRASEELLLRVIDSREPLPLLILCAFRPEHRPPWARRADVTEIVLQPLSDEGCAELVHRRLGTDTLPEEPTRFIVDKAEGNPLFAEELIRYLVETGALVRTEAGVALRRPGTGTGVPGTVRDLIMARVDRLSEGHRAVLQVASVIGRRFSLELLRVSAGVNGNLPRYLSDLESQELVFGQEAGGRQEYVFKHALIQEAIYDSLLSTRRAELHWRLAEAIEQSYGDRLVEWAEVLAHHWSQTARVDKLVRYLAMAGEKSLRVYSVEEAHERFRRVVDLVETHPGCADDRFLADVLLAWCRVHYYRKDIKALITLERYLPRMERLGDGRRLSLFLFWLGFAHVFPCRADAARPLLQRALALAETLGDDECIGYACMGLMFLHELKPFDAPRRVVTELAYRGLELGKRLGDVYLTSKCLLGLFLHDLFDGRYEPARAFALRTVELGRQADDPRAISMGLNELATANLYAERFTEAVENADEALRVSPDPLDRVVARANKGLALAFIGNAAEGLAAAREAIEDLRVADARAVGAWFDAPLGVALVISGQMAAGVRRIREAIRQGIEDGGEGVPAAGHLFLGEIYLEMVRGEKKTPFAVVLRNAGFIMRTLPFARRLTRRHLEEAARRAREADLPGILARSLFDLGVLCRASRRFDEARRHFEDALPLAEPHSATLTAKIRQALASLP